MKADFWHQRWETGQINFHESETNPFLLEHFRNLNIAKGSRIFLPLCGKTRDIAWLLAGGYQVCGAELSQLAVIQLFAELHLTPEIQKIGNLTRYSAPNIDIWVGDIFALTAENLGPIDAIYDRAALVALPSSMRERYSEHLPKITQGAPQLLITYEYDQLLMDGPPFSVNRAEVEQRYGARYRLTAIATKAVDGGMKGRIPATETAWLLQPD
jgi:thiopurine S-methyltransferase